MKTIPFKALSKKKVILVFILFLLVFLTFIDMGKSNPDEDPDDNCHISGDWSIETNSKRKIGVDRSQNFSIEIIGGGPDAVLVFNDVSVDNDEFEVSPTDRIEDNSIYDQNPTADAIFVNFTLASPNKVGTFELLFYVRSPEGIYEFGTKPYIAYLTFEIIVERPSPFTIEDFFNAVFDHYNIYLGSLAIISLAIATLLSEIDYRKYVKTHGVLSGVATVLSFINLIFIIPDSLELITLWIEYLVIDWWHLLHMILGSVGFVACGYGAITGLSGIKHRISGYVALGAWGFNFIFGILYWGIGLV
jgi:hypothetical protein